MNRMTLIKLHLYFSGIALVFLSLMTFSGSMHLLLGDETEVVNEVKTIAVEEGIDKEALSKLFEAELARIDSDYKFGYLKGSATSLVSRPTNRAYYTIKVSNGSAKIEKHEPSLRKRLMEFHMGHGARASRGAMGVLGLVVLAATLTGLWLGWSSKQLRMMTIATLTSGTVLFVILFML
ncbi:MAG: hypothetical protein EP319_06145 [Deltaproteobacteria bacterium]|nr:MAG: hypothetical protein EP319_06145 [Deltaproteobacteria bacterium]